MGIGFALGGIAKGITDQQDLAQKRQALALQTSEMQNNNSYRNAALGMEQKRLDAETALQRRTQIMDTFKMLSDSVTNTIQGASGKAPPDQIAGAIQPQVQGMKSLAPALGIDPSQIDGQVQGLLLAGQKDTPLTQNLMAAGLKPGTPEFSQGIVSAVTKPQVTMPQETAFAKTTGEGYGKDALDITKQADSAVSTLQTVNLLGKLLTDIGSNSLAPTKATIGAWAQSVGIDPKALGIDPKLPATAQALSSITNKMVVSMIGQGGFPANTFSEQDREFLVSTYPKLGDLPQAVALKTSILSRLAQLQIDRADAWDKAQSEGKSFQQFDSEWRKSVRSQNIFGDLEKAAPTSSGLPALPPGFKLMGQ